MLSIVNSRLTNVLSAFTRLEWRDFKRFITSGLFGPIGKSAELYDYLSADYPDFTGARMNKASLFNALFDNQIYDDKKLRYALTDLFRHACHYLKIKALETHPDEGMHLLTTTLAKRSADKAYLAFYNSDDSGWGSDAVAGAENYFSRYRKEFVHLNYYSPRQKRTDQNIIGVVANNLDIFFIAKKLQLLCEIINIKNVLSVERDFLLQEHILELVANGAFDKVPVIIIYYRVLMTLTRPEEEIHFDALKLLLKEHGNGFSKEELRDMYQYLMNYCIKKINQGNLRYVTILSGIYKTILENKVIYNGIHLSQWDFKNMVVIGIRAGEQDWVIDFIEKFKEDLAPGEKENAYVYNLAYYYFSVNDYRRTLSLLRKVEFTDLYYQLDMRAILLKCYYEMDDLEAYFYHVAAFRIFLSRNKLISEYQRTIYRNMIKYTTRLVRAEGDIPKIQQLSKEINEVKQVADLNWLLKKIDVNLSHKN